MIEPVVSFDAMRDVISKVLCNFPDSLAEVGRLYLVRDLRGRIRLSVSDTVETDEGCCATLARLAGSLHEALGSRSYGSDDAVLFVDSDMLEELQAAAQAVDGEMPNVYWVDRLVTGGDWWTVGDSDPERSPTRCTLFSVKGGVGRSTTSVVLAWHLAQNGERVLVVDLDLESPGLSSAMLDARTRPQFGVIDWFVEDLVGQADVVIQEMTAAPSWARDLDGDVLVAPAHGSKPGEYLAKLGRVYLDAYVPWTARLSRMLLQLEDRYSPSIVLLESRSGLHDIAAATVTDLDAQVLLFAVDSESHWTDYGILFRHWQSHGLAHKIRERLCIVSGLTPDVDTEPYLQRFRERAWDLFQQLYDDVAPSEPPGDGFSFDLNDEDAPHDPIPIHWTRGLAAGASLHNPERTTVSQAYAQFLRRFDELVKVEGDLPGSE